MTTGIRLVAGITIAVLSSVAFGQRSPDSPTKTLHLFGRVTNATGDPVANTAVSIKAPGDRLNTAITETDENGSFTLRAAIRQRYELFLEAEGFRRLTVPVKTPSYSTNLDVGVLVLRVAEIEDPSEVPYDPAPVQESLNRQTNTNKASQSPDWKLVLDWLPIDTQTLIVASRPFMIPKLLPENDSESSPIEALRTLALGRLDGFPVLYESLVGQTVSFSVAGVRRFRRFSGLGLGPYVFYGRF